MSATEKDNQFGQGSNDTQKNEGTNSYEGTNEKNTSQRTSENPIAGDDDFLSGDNEARPYPNQNNPDEGYNKSMSPGRGSNPNIGGNESEYETSTNDADSYNEETLSNNEVMNRRDNEEIDRHNDETRYSSPSSRNNAEEY
jgi:hypothetical protein